MEVQYLQAKIMPKGQITIPVEIRRKFNMKIGDHLTFAIRGNELKIICSFDAALKELQMAMEGEAEKAGLYTDEDVVKLVKEIRRGNNKD